MLNSIFEAVRDDFEAVDALIQQSLQSKIPLVEEISAYIVEAGGKRLRPLLVLLAARANGYQGRDHIKLAVVIEFLHTAMLLHDDVVDNSALRRGRATANATFGNAASVLVGDFLHSRAFEMMVEIGNLDIMALLSRATNGIAEGEVQQLALLGDTSISEAVYFEVIYRKTALLFEVAAHTGTALAGASEPVKEAMSLYGKHLGIAFQLMDDLLDYEGDPCLLGKNIGDDLAEGKVTLPLIVTLRDGSTADQSLIRNAITNPDGDTALAAVVGAVQAAGGTGYTRTQAQFHHAQALKQTSTLTDSIFKQTMIDLLRFTIDRQT